jgi:hypothetical protein
MQSLMYDEFIHKRFCSKPSLLVVHHNFIFPFDNFIQVPKNLSQKQSTDKEDEG